MEEAVRIAEETDHPYSLSIASYGARRSLPSQGGALQGHLALGARLGSLCQARKAPGVLCRDRLHLGYAYALAGRDADGVLRCSRRPSSSRLHANGRMAFAWGQPGWPRHIGWSAVWTRRRSTSSRLLSFSASVKSRDTGLGPYGFSAKSTPVARHLDVNKAEGAYNQAISLAEELGMRPLVARCHLGLGMLYRETGRLPQARSELSAAIDLFRTMEMTLWLEQGETEFAKTS